MNSPLILQPMVAMMLLTGVVWVALYAKRIPAMQRLALPTQTWTSPGKIDELLPPAVNYAAYNFRNLFELPVLFYALCLLIYVTDTADGSHLVAAWLFVGFRVSHSLIHCTSNRVMARFISYLAASLALWFMLGRVALDILV